MTDADFPYAASDDEALSAYLAGELDAAQTAAFEQRLAGDPALAARLDALAGALMTLHGGDDVALPQNFDERLEQRLVAERGTAVADLAAHRRRRDQSRRWLAVGTAAAVVAAAAVMGGSVLTGLGGGDGAEVATVEDAGGGEAMMESDVQGQGGDAAAGSAGAAGPVILNEQVPVADEDALRRRYADIPEDDALLGVPVDEARVLADAYSQQVAVQNPALSRSSPRTAGGADEEEAADDGATESTGAPADTAARGTCLRTITAGADVPLVPVRVETLQYAGDDALAYVLVTAAPGADALDRTEVWVVDPEDCATLVFQQF